LTRLHVVGDVTDKNTENAFHVITDINSVITDKIKKTHNASGDTDNRHKGS